MITTDTGSRRFAFARSVPLTLGVLAVTASVSIVGPLDEQVLQALRRERDAISSGQAWRLVTAGLDQDGGVPGTLFNLLGLLAVGSVAERTLKRPTWTAAYLTGT